MRFSIRRDSTQTPKDPSATGRARAEEPRVLICGSEGVQVGDHRAQVNRFGPVDDAFDEEAGELESGTHGHVRYENCHDVQVGDGGTQVNHFGSGSKGGGPSASVSNSRGVQIGNHNVQVNSFGPSDWD